MPQGRTHDLKRPEVCGFGGREQTHKRTRRSFIQSNFSSREGLVSILKRSVSSSHLSRELWMIRDLELPVYVKKRNEVLEITEENSLD